jgi:hypothetical protein
MDMMKTTENRLANFASPCSSCEHVNWQVRVMFATCRPTDCSFVNVSLQWIFYGLNKWNFVQRNRICCSLLWLRIVSLNLIFNILKRRWHRFVRSASSSCTNLHKCVCSSLQSTIYSLHWHATAAPNPRQQVCRNFISMWRQQWIIEGRLVAALPVTCNIHTYTSRYTPPPIPCTQNPHKFFLILWLIYYTFFFLSLWREGFCFVKSRQVCFLGRRGPNTLTRNGYFSVSPFWNIYYKIVGLQYLVLFNLQSLLCDVSDIVLCCIVLCCVVCRCTSNPSHKCYIKLHQMFLILVAKYEFWNVSIWVQQFALCAIFKTVRKSVQEFRLESGLGQLADRIVVIEHWHTASDDTTSLSSMFIYSIQNLFCEQNGQSSVQSFAVLQPAAFHSIPL